MKQFIASVLMVAATVSVAAPEYKPLPIEQREAAPSPMDFPQAVQYQAPRVDNANGANPSQSSYPVQPAQPPVASNVQWELYNQLQQMQQELAELRGLVEQQTHEITQLKQQQRQRYLDLDHRLNQIKAAPASVSTEPVAVDAPATAEGLDEKKTYDQAIGLMRERKFSDAISLLEQLLKASPKSELVPNSEYWLGELYMVIDPPDLDVAKKHFITLLRDFNDHQKVPDALYKLGKLYNAQGEKAKARVTLEKVIADYPTRQAASHAKKLLANL